MASRKESAASASSPLDSPVKQIQIDGLVSDCSEAESGGLLLEARVCVCVFGWRWVGGAQRSSGTALGEKNCVLWYFVDMYYGTTRVFNMVLPEIYSGCTCYRHYTMVV